MGGEPMAIIAEFQWGKSKIDIYDDAYREQEPEQLQVAQDDFYQAAKEIIRNYQGSGKSK